MPSVFANLQCVVVIVQHLYLPLQDLEEELELDRRRVSEAEGVAKRAEEELSVAKERLLLQEDELQNRAGMSVRECWEWS